MRLPLAALMALVLLAPTALQAHYDDMLRLPAHDEFGCLNCHNGEGATRNYVPDTGGALPLGQFLNPFGQDWFAIKGAGADLDDIWGPDLAGMNSDGDGCTNGFELGDPQGLWNYVDGTGGASAFEQEGNPGGESPDCTLPINNQSWGVLKTLFGD